MASEFHHSLEPFPLFIDSAPPNSANYFSSPMAMAAIQLLATTSSSSSPSPNDRLLRKSRLSVPAKVSNYLRLRYYQYEVTLGLYMLSPTEKIIFNATIFLIVIALLLSFFWGLQPFLVHAVCRAIYYVTGSSSPAPQLCS